MTPWLLMDYGEVISLPHDERAGAELARLVGLPAEDLMLRYWRHRPAYDAGLDAGEYWERVLGCPADDVDRLVEVDLSGWQRLDPAMLDLLDEQAAAGVRLALLSNAPHAQADLFDVLAWTDRFEQVFVSARLGLVKPDPALYRRVLDGLGARPDEVTFVDDRPANADAAAALGFRTVRFTGVEDLRASLAG